MVPRHEASIKPVLDGLLTTLVERKPDTKPTESGVALIVALDQLIAVSEEIVQTAHRQLAALQRDRNQLLLIRRLPFELLQEIFRLCIWDESRKIWSYSTLRSIQRTCTHWAKVVENTPKFWTSITERRTEKSAELSIRHSRGLPLDVRLTGTSDRNVNSQYVDFVAPLSHRWGSLRINTTDSQTIQRMLAVPAPILKTLSIDGNWASSSGIAAPLFSDNAPQLEELTIRRFVLPWTSGVISGLRHLELNFQSVFPSPSVDQLLPLLAASPALRFLQVSGEIAELAVTQPAVHVPELARMVLKDVSHMAAARFLDNVILPRTTRVSVCVKWVSGLASTTSANAMTRSVCHRLAFLADGVSSSTISVVRDLECFRFDYASGGIELALKPGPYSVSDVSAICQSFFDAIAPARLTLPTALTLGFGLRWTIEEVHNALVFMDSNFTSVVHLSLHVDRLGMLDVLRAPIKIEGKMEQERWLFPAMKSCTLRGHRPASDHPAIVDLIRARAAQQASGVALLEGLEISNSNEYPVHQADEVKSLMPTVIISSRRRSVG
ncbi:hypothetical protein FRB99_005273 [Tulasnella sp. 403]|nr:hypothetical protein FRB99_005273 [Tulasnella sp. 403]